MAEEAPTTEQLLAMVRRGELLPEGTRLEGSAGIEQLSELLAPNLAPDFVTVMYAESAVLDYKGVEGFREALSDWISPYERFEFVIDRTVVVDDKLIFLVRQVATTKHDGVEVETPSGTVWWVRDGMIAKAVFFLDQHSALKAAGLDPDQLPES